MKALLTTAALFAAALFILDVPAARADTHTWDGSEDVYWSTPGNWDPAAVPDTTDDVVIPSTGVTNEPTFDADDTVASIEVRANRTLTLAANPTTGSLTIKCDGVVLTGAYTLTITGSNGLTIDAATGGCADPGRLNVSGAGTVVLSGGGTSQTVNGKLILAVDQSRLSITSDCTIDGTGSVDGEDPNALIEIADGITLKSTTTIEGMLQIVDVPGNGTTRFINHSSPGGTGLVHANAAGTLQINVEALDYGDTTNVLGNWRVSTSESAVLQFTTGSVLLDGRFDIDTGTLDVDANITTTGVLDFAGGKIEVYNNMTFQGG